ncbi:MAG: hypothetical protein AAF208_06995 [Cyanobacteria bacterium P01_A01_bin.45]
MNRKIATIITGTVLIFTNFSLPASALKTNEEFSSNNLENSYNKINIELETSQRGDKNEDILIARKYKRIEWDEERLRSRNRRYRDVNVRRREDRRWDRYEERGTRRRRREDRRWDRYEERGIRRRRNRDWDRYGERDIRRRRREDRRWDRYDDRRYRRRRRKEIRRLREIERICRYERPRGRTWRNRCRQIRRNIRDRRYR